MTDKVKIKKLSETLRSLYNMSLLMNIGIPINNDGKVKVQAAMDESLKLLIELDA
jgi:hypothetical protein